MRSTVFSILVAFPLAACPAADGAGAAPAWPEKVSGFGLTVDGAKKHGLQEAVRLVAEYLHQMDPPLLEWDVTEEFVEKKLLDGPGSPGLAVKIGNSEEGTSWIYRLKPPDHDLFIRLNRQVIGARRLAERQVVSAERLQQAGWIFGGMLTLLVLAMAYGRLAGRRRH